LSPHPAIAKFLPKPFGVIAFISSHHPESFFGSSDRGSLNVDLVYQRQNLLAFISISRSCTATDGHPIAIGEQMNQNPFAFSSIAHSFIATLARGKKSYPRLHTLSELGPSPGQ
jgi:hypothetical protein